MLLYLYFIVVVVVNLLHMTEFSRGMMMGYILCQNVAGLYGIR